jgi:D-alanine-D-alanine ligase
MVTHTVTSPKIVAITNENPNWLDADKQWADETWFMLLKGLNEEGYTYKAHKFFDDLSFLDQFSPREWLVWNWGEEWAGQAWTDAEVAEQIERRGFAYTGSPPDAIRLAQDRIAVKRHLLAAGLPTLPARVFYHPAEASEWTAYPSIVKGANQHASVGIDGSAVVHTPQQLARRVLYLREHLHDDALVERFLDTREFHVAVWGNETPEVLPPCEIDYSAFTDMHDRLYTHQWKTDRDSHGYKDVRLLCPALLDRPDWHASLEGIALRAYQVVGLRDYARFDFRMLGDEPQILDVNANPELWSDERSVVVAAAKAKGLAYGQMVSRIIQFAAMRMPPG